MASRFLKRRIFIIHTLFWCVYFSFFLYTISMQRDGVGRPLDQLLLDAGFHVAAMMAISYINYFIFFPRFLQHKNVIRYALEFIPPFVVMMAATIYGKRLILESSDIKAHFLYSWRFVIYMSVTTMFLVLFVAMLKFVEDWFELETRKKELEHEKLNSELQFLKAQINPHFLFNTLNNLYYLAFTQSPNTVEVIAKLSQMMRYMIYDSNHATVPLTKEIEYMENYISLEKLRLNHPIPIEFKVNGDPSAVKVTPLILITFLENAFKHGVSGNSPDAWVNVELSLKDRALDYIVENSILAQKDEKTKEKSGIGLQNAYRRLELSYPGRYQLETRPETDRYRVHLTLQLP